MVNRCIENGVQCIRARTSEHTRRIGRTNRRTYRPCTSKCTMLFDAIHHEIASTKFSYAAKSDGLYSHIFETHWYLLIYFISYIYNVSIIMMVMVMATVVIIKIFLWRYTAYILMHVCIHHVWLALIQLKWHDDCACMLYIYDNESWSNGPPPPGKALCQADWMSYICSRSYVDVLHALALDSIVKHADECTNIIKYTCSCKEHAFDQFSFAWIFPHRTFNFSTSFSPSFFFLHYFLSARFPRLANVWHRVRLS